MPSCAAEGRAAGRRGHLQSEKTTTPLACSAVLCQPHRQPDTSRLPSACAWTAERATRIHACPVVCARRAPAMGDPSCRSTRPRPTPLCGTPPPARRVRAVDKRKELSLPWLPRLHAWAPRVPRAKRCAVMPAGPQSLGRRVPHPTKLLADMQVFTEIGGAARWNRSILASSAPAALPSLHPTSSAACIANMIVAQLLAHPLHFAAFPCSQLHKLAGAPNGWRAL